MIDLEEKKFKGRIKKLYELVKRGLRSETPNTPIERS